MMNARFQPNKLNNDQVRELAAELFIPFFQKELTPKNKPAFLGLPEALGIQVEKKKFSRKVIVTRTKPNVQETPQTLGMKMIRLAFVMLDSRKLKAPKKAELYELTNVFISKTNALRLLPLPYLAMHMILQICTMLGYSSTADHKKAVSNIREILFQNQFELGDNTLDCSNITFDSHERIARVVLDNRKAFNETAKAFVDAFLKHPKVRSTSKAVLQRKLDVLKQGPTEHKSFANVEDSQESESSIDLSNETMTARK